MTNVRFRGDPRRLGHDEVNRWNRTATRDQLGQLRKSGVSIPTSRRYDPNARVVFAENTTASDRARFECMGIDATDCLLWQLDENGEFDVVFKLAAADPELAPAMLIEPIAAGEFGRVVIDGPAIAKIETADDAGYRFATPQTSTHSLLPTAAGPIKLLAAPSISAATWVPVVLNYGTGGATMLAGLVNANFSGTPGTFAIKEFYAISGAAPDDATLTVANRFEWEAGTVDTNVIVVWDPETEQWIPLQMECPA